jgi:Protein of unknown function (DUF2695)
MAHTPFLMAPSHPKWRAFAVALAGPEGCDFHKDSCGDPVTWKCDSNIKRPFCRRLLKKFGADVDGSLEFFAKHGGYCDCEVIFNVERGVNPVKPVRRRRRTRKEKG